MTYGRDEMDEIREQKSKREKEIYILWIVMGVQSINHNLYFDLPIVVVVVVLCYSCPAVFE
jgi:hypothetical protein